MTDDRARETFFDALGQVAPEVDPGGLDPVAPLRDAADLDSMDFLTLVGALAEALGGEIPEDDYPRLGTVADAVAYVHSRLG